MLGWIRTTTFKYLHVLYNYLIIQSDNYRDLHDGFNVRPHRPYDPTIRWVNKRVHWPSNFSLLTSLSLSLVSTWSPSPCRLFIRLLFLLFFVLPNNSFCAFALLEINSKPRDSIDRINHHVLPEQDLLLLLAGAGDPRHRVRLRLRRFRPRIPQDQGLPARGIRERRPPWPALLHRCRRPPSILNYFLLRRSLLDLSAFLPFFSVLIVTRYIIGFETLFPPLFPITVIGSLMYA